MVTDACMPFPLTNTAQLCGTLYSSWSNIHSFKYTAFQDWHTALTSRLVAAAAMEGSAVLGAAVRRLAVRGAAVEGPAATGGGLALRGAAPDEPAAAWRAKFAAWPCMTASGGAAPEGPVAAGRAGHGVRGARCAAWPCMAC